MSRSARPPNRPIPIAVLDTPVVRDAVPRTASSSAYRGRRSRDWLKAKVSETGALLITGFVEREVVAVVELKVGVLVPGGLIKFGLAGKGLWRRLNPLRDGPASRAGIIPVRPELIGGVKFFVRYRSGAIRDGVLLAVG